MVKTKGKNPLNAVNHEWWVFVYLWVMYSLLTLPWLTSGLNSLDAHGIIQTVERLLATGDYISSRPPGHPSSALYLLYPIAFLLKFIFGLNFTPTIYLLVQYLGGIIALYFFIKLLFAMQCSSGKVFFAGLSLVLSTPFILNTVDGEEFVFGLACILGAILLLNKANPIPDRIRKSYLFGSLFICAFATGFRPELILMFLMYPIFFFTCHRRNFIGYTLISALVALIFLVIVWSPFLFPHLSLVAPYPTSISLRNKILVGFYKITFQGLGLPLFFVYLLIYLAFSYEFICKKNYRQKHFISFVLYTSLLIVPLYALVFLVYPTKTSFMIVVIPAVLILSVHLNRIYLYLVVVLSFLTLFIGVDIFKDRVLTGPQVDSGFYTQLILSKPEYRSNYINHALKQTLVGKNIIVLKAYPWDLLYYKNANKHCEFIGKTEHLCLIQNTDPQNIYCAQTILDPKNIDQLRSYQEQGYKIWIDPSLYRTVFSRYDINQVLPREKTIDGIDFHLLESLKTG